MYDCNKLELTPYEFWTKMEQCVHPVSPISVQKYFKIFELRDLQLCHLRCGTQLKCFLQVQQLVRDVKVCTLRICTLAFGKHCIEDLVKDVMMVGGTVRSWK